MSGLGRRASLIVLLASTAAAAQDKPAIARFVPPAPDPAHVFVLDSAHILSAATILALQDSARALQAETHADVAWVTLPTLGGRSIEQAALYIGRTWRIGSAGQPGDPLRNRGLVVLFVPDKSKTAGPNFRIEVGRGLEGTITDSRSRSITTAMRDDLRAKQYDAAYMKGWEVAARLVREDFAAAANIVAPAAAVPAPAAKSNAGKVIAIVIVSTLLVVIVVGVVLASRRRRTGPRTMAFKRRVDSVRGTSASDDDDLQRRMLIAMMNGMAIGSSSANSDDNSGGGDSDSSSSSSDGGSFGDGGGFSGGGSSDTI